MFDKNIKKLAPLARQWIIAQCDHDAKKEIVDQKLYRCYRSLFRFLKMFCILVQSHWIYV